MASKNAPGPKKTSLSTYVIYIVIALIILIACWFVGAAFDYAVKPDGKIDASLLEQSFSIVADDPKLMLNALSVENGYAPKMIVMGVIVIGIYALYKYSEGKKRLHRQGVEHGSAKWGDTNEKKKLADQKVKPKQLPMRDENGKKMFDDKGEFVVYTMDNNIILTEDVMLSLDARQHLLNLNVLAIGGSGAGKTRFFAKPNAMQLNTSEVFTDPKGEILKSCGKMLEGAGYKIRVFNLIDMKHSNNYNPFHYVYDYNGELSEDSIKKMVDVLFKNTKGEGEKDDFWSQKGQSMLEAITFLLFEESEYNAEYDENGHIKPETRDLTHLNFFSVTEKMRKLIYPPRGSQLPDGFFLERAPDESEEEFRERQASAFLCPLDKDFIELEKRKPDSLALRLYKEVRNAPEETGQSFLSSANVKTFMFNLSNVKNLTCCDNIHLETIGDEKTALFLIIPATNTTYNFLAAMLYTQMFDVLSDRANFKYGGRLPVHVRCIMDEFANIGQIPDFDKVIAFVRSMGMSLNVIIQNMAQLKARYEKTWEVITGNCDSTLFLGGKEASTLKEISEALGKETIDVRGHNRTKGRQSSTSENNSILGRELMLPNELQVMPISDCIVMIRSHNPFYCAKYPIEKHPNFKFLEDYDSSNAFDVTKVKVVTMEEFEKTNAQKANSKESLEEEKKREEKIEVIFKREGVDICINSEMIVYDSYEEAELYDEDISEDGDIFEEYIPNAPAFGDVSELDAFDLGEPIREQTEVEDYDDDSDSDISIDEIVNDFFSEPEEPAENISDIEENEVEAELAEFEYYSEAAQFPDEDDYGIFEDF